VVADGDRGVWLDDANAIFRRGLASCLESDGFALAGESAGLRPEPDLSHTSVLVFDVDDVGLARATMLVRSSGVGLVALIRDVREEQVYDAITAGVAGVLVRRELTPARFTACIRSVLEGNGAMPPRLLGQVLVGLARGAPRGGGAGALARREVDVLRLLAKGDSTREIAEELAYSERTVKNIVHDLLVKLNCRTRAHAVALATREGVI
jgi:DNA-binding NarL/FixJ family response regulator